ncbi:hypothetical protein HYQ45_010351 [Verticillium longisporum]|uniref:Uncharacterized protein n=1 Tax=Verticillium longisporum TaxID=100787 RepID=A0A8I3ANX6_VERLO|nr:hypothetical protein HYQ45_010351 [Verticillium longisporum]
MKFLVLFFLSLVALISAAVIDPDRHLIQRDLEAATDGEDVQVIDYQLSDGRHKIDVIVNGVFDGSLITTEDGEVVVLDAEGKQLELDESNDDNTTIVKRSRLKVLIRLAKVIKKYGRRILNFLGCIGWKTALKCAAQIEWCTMTGGQMPWVCERAVSCIGKIVKECR